MISLQHLRLYVKSGTPLIRFFVRGILSEAYSCDEAWQKRLQSPLLRDIKMDQYFVDTDKKFATKRLVSGVDIDLFANRIDDASKLDELEHLLCRFRMTKRAPEMMDSTNYAVVKALLKFREYESLMRLLSDRESYGVFPDHFSYNMIMSTFLKEKMYSEAARVAILFMLQEDFENRISCVLGIYSCQMFLNHNSLDSLHPVIEEVEESEVKADTDEDEDEMQLVRVPFLRNPWFDEHFDLSEPKHLIGKTFYLLGRQMVNTCGRSYQLVGLAMFGKWEKAYNLLTSFYESKDADILSEAVSKVMSVLAEVPDDENNSKEKWTNKFEELFQKMKTQKKIQNGELMPSLECELKNALQCEKDDIEAQKKLFSYWEEQRCLALEKQNAQIDKEKRLKAIEEKKEYLYWKEKLLFFFENEDKNLEELKKVEEIVAAIKSDKRFEDTYVPPVIERKSLERLTKYQKLIRVKRSTYR